MHAIAVLGLFSLVGTAAAVCAHDDCLRQVIASAFPTRHGIADCSSYFSDAPPVTYTPPATTVTSSRAISTKTIGTTTVFGRRRRQIRDIPDVAPLIARQAPTIPAYASSCNPSKYFTACSCVGIFSTVTTMPPTKTATTRVTATVVSTSVVPQPTLTVNQYLFSTCNLPARDPSFTVTPGQCVQLDTAISVNFAAFTIVSGSTCTCTVNFYEFLDCTQLTQVVAPTFTGCVNTSVYFSMSLSCTC